MIRNAEHTSRPVGYTVLADNSSAGLLGVALGSSSSIVCVSHGGFLVVLSAIEMRSVVGLAGR